MSFISCNDIFTVKANVIYLSIELSVKKNSGVKYRAAECCFPRVHYLSIMPKVEAEILQVTYSVEFFSQSMVSRCTTNSEEKNTRLRHPLEVACFRELHLTTAELRLCSFFSTATICRDIHVYVDSLKEKLWSIYCSIYILKKNVNIGQRCSSLHTVQSHELS